MTTENGYAVVAVKIAEANMGQTNLSVIKNMTKLRNIKIWVGNNPDLCKKIQRHLFKNGCSWAGRVKGCQFEHSYALYIDDAGYITYTTKQTGRKYFNEHQNIEINPHNSLFDDETVVIVNGTAYV